MAEDAPISNTPEESSAEFTEPAVTPRSYQQDDNVSSTRLRFQPNRRLLIGLLVLIFLVLSSVLYAFPLRPRIPSANGFVKITPASHLISDNYYPDNVLGSTNSTKNPIAARRIARTTSSQSMKVSATGKIHHDATMAQGNVSITIQQGKPKNMFNNFSLVSSSGVQIVIQNASFLVSTTTGVYSASAEAQNPGARGNIPAYDIDGPYQSQQDPSLILYIQNTRSFTGGTDASDTSTVQQSDIDTATNTLESKLNASISPVEASVQNQLASTEQFMNGIQCNPQVTSNHHANDVAPDVTVSVVIECFGIAYNVSKMMDFATASLSQLATSQLGTNYALVGEVDGHIVPDSVTSSDNNTVTYTLATRGIWVFQVTKPLRQHFATMIEGQPLTDAKTLLLRQQGIAAVDIQTSGGLGTALPSSVTNMQVVVVSVKGIA